MQRLVHLLREGLVSLLRKALVSLVQAHLVRYVKISTKANLLQMAEFANSYITEHQFAQLIGKSKLYNYLPAAEKKALPNFQFLDCHINSIAEDYYADKSFCREANGNINLWNLYNLFTGANKNSYIDKFLTRGLNASQFVSSLHHALKEKQNFWFIE